jgi:hypothetical protein
LQHATEEGFGVASFGPACFMSAGLIDGYETEVFQLPDLVPFVETATEDSRVCPKV